MRRRLPLYLGLLCGLLVALAITNRDALTSTTGLLALLALVLGIATFVARRR